VALGNASPLGPLVRPERDCNRARWCPSDALLIRAGTGGDGSIRDLYRLLSGVEPPVTPRL
jgi:hypothetical protein